MFNYGRSISAADIFVIAYLAAKLAECVDPNSITEAQLRKWEEEAETVNSRIASMGYLPARFRRAPDSN